MHAHFILAGLVLLAFVAPGRAADPEPAEVWQLVRNATVLYESLDGVDYDIKVQSPELDALLAAKTGGFGGAPDVRFIRRNQVSRLGISLPGMPEIFRAKAEARLEQESNSVDAMRMLRELGWTLFASFLRTVESGGQYDIIEWNDKEALIEFNELSEPLMSRIMRSCRIRFDRKNSRILQSITWYGGKAILDVSVDYDPKEFFPGTKLPLVKVLRTRQTGFRGPEFVTFGMLDGKYERSAIAQTDESSTSRRAMLRRAGFNRFQIDQTRVDADGNISLDFAKSPIAVLPKLDGLPVNSVNLTKTAVSDLAPLKGLPLTRLILDDCPVTDLSPVAEMKLEYLSLRGLRTPDMNLIGRLPLKRLSLAGSSNPIDLSALSGLKLEGLDVEERPVTDINVLRGMPLYELSLNRTKVKDLSPLSGSPVARLECFGTPVVDLAPLAQCRSLENLRVHNTKVSDLRPLTGLKLNNLRINDTPVADLNPLRGMPLRVLAAQGSGVTDVSPLLECPDLERLTLPRSVKNVEVLRNHPRLRELSFRFDTNKDGPAQTVEEFWREIDAGTPR